MQASHDESNVSSGTGEGSGTQRLDKDTDRVELVGDGRPVPIGYCYAFQLMKGMRTDHVHFDMIRSPSFVFEHAAALLAVQGKYLQEFFSPWVYFQYKKAGAVSVVSHGPYILLEGALSKTYDPPLRLQNLVLAHVLSSPEDMSRDRLLAVLLHAVQKKNKRPSVDWRFF